MKILVAGGAGYIGSELVPALLKEEHKVKVVDLFWFEDHLPEGCEKVRKPIRDISKEDLREMDAVIFLGGLTNDPMAEYDPLSNYILNAAEVAYLAQIAKESKVGKFIFASSCSVYGFTPDKMVDEEEVPKPQFPYGISKLMAERALLALVDTYFNVIILRKGTVGGYSPRMRYDLVVNTMTKTALQKGKLVVRNASLWRPVVDINDVVEVYKEALKAEPWLSGIYNIVEKNYTILELGNQVADAIEDFKGSRPEIEVYDRFDLRNYRASGQKARDSLGFAPEFPVLETVRELLERIKEGEIADFENPNYYNIEVMKRMKK